MLFFPALSLHIRLQAAHLNEQSWPSSAPPTTDLKTERNSLLGREQANGLVMRECYSWLAHHPLDLPAQSALWPVSTSVLSRIRSATSAVCL
ncbi:hypothetical protein DL89DRAFT_270664 [Linderina pennispora]|uniref:Uncharacterized protein n=1 Tax=Linderina pennispora TaxID=61395 RepID=A0A1Y1VWN8_9FUNG|nr:uncharacterized protein DL89DRAFT_270664 [Linderina pennispora]ORX65717.1 hypothetical protein DL89DRAFT_270664 [Linderina pennispora]